MKIESTPKSHYIDNLDDSLEKSFFGIPIMKYPYKLCSCKP
jgi:hypothetical protein